MKSYIGILRPYSENALSNLYAYFLNKETCPGVSQIFLESILDIILEQFDHDDVVQLSYNVKREFQTDKGNSIDIVIDFNHPNQRSKSFAIIIENKINHELKNDLKDYWNDIDYANDDRKILIILSYKNQSLDTTDIPNIRFITHWEMKEAFRYRMSKSSPELGNRLEFIINDYCNYIDELYLKDDLSKIELEKYWNGTLENETEYIKNQIKHFIALRNTNKYDNTLWSRYFTGLKYKINIDKNKNINTEVLIHLSAINDVTSEIPIHEFQRIYNFNHHINTQIFQAVINIQEPLKSMQSIVEKLEEVFIEFDKLEDSLKELYQKNQKEFYKINLVASALEFINNNYSIFLNNQKITILTDEQDEYFDDFIIFETFDSICCLSLDFRIDNNMILSLWADSKSSYSKKAYRDYLDKNSFTTPAISKMVSLKSNEGIAYYYLKFIKIYKIEKLDTIKEELLSAFEDFKLFFENAIDESVSND